MEVANELWEQASKRGDFTDVNSICKTIDEGIVILISKLDEINCTHQIIQNKSGSFKSKK